jgi:hypothetical protein
MVAKKNKLDFASKYKVSKFVLSKVNREGVITLMHIEEYEYFYTISGVATQLWLMLDGKRTLEENLDRLSKKTNTPARKLRVEVAQFLKDLLKEKLVEKIT